MENKRIVKVNIRDNELFYDRDFPDGVLREYYLINPDEDKLNELKRMIENRLEYQHDDNLTDEEIEKAEKFCDSIWDHIDDFVQNNFFVLSDIYEYEIEY